MKDEEAFISAIRASDCDRVPRLVYANWLEERGDPRAELVRLEAELAELPPYSERYAMLKPRSKELRQQCNADWLQAMGYVPRHRPLFGQLPHSRAERWRLVEEFIENWYGALKPRDGYSQKELDDAEARLGFRLPAALREWYQLAGRRFDVWCRTLGMYFMEPTALGLVMCDLLVFRMDDFEGYVSWGIRINDLGQEDPPVWGIGPSGSPDSGESESVFECSPTTTFFAVMSMLEELPIKNPQVIVGRCQGDWSEQVRRSFQKCDFTIGRYYPGDNSFVSEVYEGIDTLVRLGRYHVSVTARNEEAFARLDPSLRKNLKRDRQPQGS
jgi:uncharacterized protein (TIGR02996 family)